MLEEILYNAIHVIQNLYMQLQEWGIKNFRELNIFHDESIEMQF